MAVGVEDVVAEFSAIRIIISCAVDTGVLSVTVNIDKGLAGALNTNLLREAARFDAEKTAYVVAGKKARQFLSRTRRDAGKPVRLGRKGPKIGFASPAAGT